MTALYVLANEYRHAADRLATLDLDETTISDTLESMVGDLQEKSIATAMAARNLESLAASIKEAEAGMAARRKAIESRVTRIREYLLTNMETAQISRIESPYFTLAIQENPPAVVIDCAVEIPEDYFKQPETPPPVVDKKLIAQAIKDGYTVPGAHLERGKRLVIK